MVSLVVDDVLTDALTDFLIFVSVLYFILAGLLWFKYLMNWAVADITVFKRSMTLVLGFAGYAMLRAGILLKTALTQHATSISLIIPTLVYLFVSAMMAWVWGRYCNKLRPYFSLAPRWYYNAFTAVILCVALVGIAFTCACAYLPEHFTESQCINADAATDIISCEITGLVLLLVSTDLKEVFMLSGSYRLDLRVGGGWRYYVASFFNQRNLPWRIFNGLRLFSIYSLLRGLFILASVFGGSALHEQNLALIIFYLTEILFLITSITTLVGPPSSKSDPRLLRQAQHGAAVREAAAKLLNTQHSMLNAARMT